MGSVSAQAYGRIPCRSLPGGHPPQRQSRRHRAYPTRTPDTS